MSIEFLTTTQSQEHRRTFYFKKFSKANIEKIEKIVNCKDIVEDWEDPNDFGWLKKPFRLVAPPPVITVSQWADLYRQISTEFAAESGQWHTSKFEAMREVMDNCSPHSKYRRVVLVKPVQSGGSEACVLNVIGYTIDINPRSMLVVFPTLDSCESFSKERLDPMFAGTASLQGKVNDVSVSRKKAGEMISTVKKKKYPGGFLNLVGANSTTGLSSRPVPIVIVDEVDLCIKNASRQGNPVKLALSRTTTFFDRKEILLSSPSNEEGESGIIPFWEEGTRGKLYRSCPNLSCECMQILDFDRMDLETAMLACERCGQYFPQWKWHSTSQEWIHENVDHATTVSYWMTGLDSPWLDWKVDIVDDYLDCKKLMDNGGDDSLMRVFVNSKLTKYYRRRGKRVDIDLYHDRREVYECHSIGAEVPEGVVLITAGVDVADSFISYDITGWGRGRESWGIETGEFQGDPRIPDSIVWKQLDEFVYRRIWRYSNGDFIRTRLMFVDSQGHCTDDVYKYTKVRHPRCFAIKGVGGSGHPIIIGGKRREKGEGAWLVRLGVDTLKDEFHSRLSVDRPGPGYCHWPMQPNGMPACGYTLEYFEEVISEQRELVYNRSGFAEYRWTKNRTEANEALDERVYARAALEYLKIRLEQISRDTVKLAPNDMDRVEIGTDRFIFVEKSKMKTNTKTKYGTGRIEGLSVTSESGQEGNQGSEERYRTRTRYGAASTSF